MDLAGTLPETVGSALRGPINLFVGADPAQRGGVAVKLKTQLMRVIRGDMNRPNRRGLLFEAIFLRKWIADEIIHSLPRSILYFRRKLP